MTISETDTLAAIQVLTAAGVPIVLWGDPGTGKTQTIERLAARAGWHVETVIASLHDPTDFGGLPVLTPDGVVHEPPVWAKRVAAHDGRCLVFLDEVNTATPATQNALMNMVHSGRIGQHSLGSQVGFIAAANPPEQNVGAWDLSAPLANRFAHLRWPVDFDAWRSGYLGGWPTTEPLNAEPPSVERRRWWRAMQTAFLARRPGWLCKVPDDDSAASVGWPSPRTWERTAECLAVAENAQAAPTVVSLVAESLIGPAAAAEFIAFIRNLDLPDPEALIAEPASLSLPDRADRQFACLEAVTAAVLSRNTPKRWKAAFEVCIEAAAQGTPDIAAAAARTLAGCRPSGARLPAGYEIFDDILAAAALGDPDER